MTADIYYNDYEDGWESEFKTTFAYDNNGNKTVKSSYSSDFNDDTWELNNRKFYDYTDMTSKESPEDDDCFAAYPNPASERVRLAANTDAKDEEVKFVIFNPSGKQIFSKKESGRDKSEAIWKCKNYPSGTYMAVLELGNKKVTQKTVVK